MQCDILISFNLLDQSSPDYSPSYHPTIWSSHRMKLLGTTFRFLGMKYYAFIKIGLINISEIVLTVRIPGVTVYWMKVMLFGILKIDFLSA